VQCVFVIRLDNEPHCEITVNSFVLRGNSVQFVKISR